MTHSVRRHLDVQITAYDETIRRWVPGYDEMLAEAARAVARVSPAHVVDLGAGTGALAEAVFAHASVGLVELLDVDAEMMEQARARLGRAGSRVRFTEGSYLDPLPSCNAVCASLSLHHLPTLDQKRELYRAIHGALQTGGVFVNADIMVPPDGPSRDADYQAWVEHKVARGIPAEQAWTNFAAWAEEDTYFPLETELALLQEVGFTAACTWRSAPSTVLVASKA